MLHLHVLSTIVRDHPMTAAGTFEFARRAFIGICTCIGFIWILDKASKALEECAMWYACYREHKRWRHLLPDPPRP